MHHVSTVSTSAVQEPASYPTPQTRVIFAQLSVDQRFPLFRLLRCQFPVVPTLFLAAWRLELVERAA